MKKIFFSVLVSVIVINLLYKSFIYLTYDKVRAEVIEIKTVKRIVTLRNGNKAYEEFDTPIIIFEKNNQFYRVENYNWGEVNLLKPKDKVTLLMKKEKNDDVIYLNTFFDFWFTVSNLTIGFFVVIVISVLLGNILPEKKEKISEWK